MIKTSLKIDGMMCEMCESHMNDVIRNNFKVQKVKSSHKKGQTEVVSEESLDEEKLATVIANIGYTLEEKSEEPYERKKLFGLFK